MVKNNLSKILGERRITLTQVFENTGISRSTLGQIYNEKSKMIRHETIDTLCNYLQISVGELLDMREAKDSSFADNLKIHRNRKGISQANLALELGVSKFTVSKYEQGLREPSLPMLDAIAEVLEVTLPELLGYPATKIKYAQIDLSNVSTDALIDELRRRTK